MPENPRIEELRRRVQADPASIAFAALAEEFRRVGRYEEAIEACRTGLQRHPAYLSARVTLGRALIEMGDFDGAREELETVLRSAPENLAAIRGLAQIHERMGHSAEMDPDLAAYHAESVAAAAAAPPRRPEPDAPPIAHAAPTPPIAQAEPEATPDTPIAAEPAADFSFGTTRDEPASDGFDLSIAPSRAEAPSLDLSFDPAPAPAMDSAPAAAEPASRRIDPFASFVPPAAAAPAEPEVDPFAIAPPTAAPAPTPIPLKMPERLPIAVSRQAPVPEPEPEPALAPAIDLVEELAIARDADDRIARDADDRIARDANETIARDADDTIELLLEPHVESIHDAPMHVDPMHDEPMHDESPLDESMTGESMHVAAMYDAAPDPETLATLARLEQFLAAIQHARHA